MRWIVPAGLLYTLILFSCSKEKKADGAIFMESGPISVQAAPGQGSNSHRISDLWVYVNGQYIGAYPAGNLIPIASKGLPVSINVLPGIRNNGIEATRLYYPLYESVYIDTTLPVGTRFFRPFTFRYHPNAKFIWTEDFSPSVGLTVTKSQGSDTTFKQASKEESFDGNSIELGLTGTALLAQIQSSGEGFALPGSNPNLYLELNYKGDTWFLVALVDKEGYQRDVITIAPQSNWNKIYIELAPAVNYPTVSSRYKVIFKTVKDLNTASARIFLDNIKIVYK